MENRKINLRDLLKKLIKLLAISIYLSIIISMIAGGVIAGIMTLTPPEGFGWTVSKNNYLDYMSICSFAPFSSLLLFGMASIAVFLLIKLLKYLRRKTKKSEIYFKLKALVNKIN